MKKTFIIIASFLILFGFVIRADVYADTPDITYPLYGGWNPHDTYAAEDGWEAGSDNVVWDFASKDQVYRQINSLSLRYNPKGEFHITRPDPFSITSFKWLAFVGRAEDDDLDFSITFTDKDNKPIGNALKFSEHGGKPTDTYWTNYNFPIEDFGIGDGIIGGLRITQLSEGWGEVLYLDEIYFSKNRGENINPALPTPNPLDTPTPPIEKRPKYPPDTNPFVFIIPAIFAAIIVMFH